MSAALACLVALPAAAQEQDEQLWIKLDAGTSLADNVSLILEMNQRLGDAEGGIYESQYLVAVGWRITEGVTLTGGINRVVAVEGGRVDNTEWRPRQQISFPIAQLGSGALKGRLRFEQRFRSDGDDVGHRVRPEIAYALPINDDVELELSHESYFNLNTTDFGQRAGHERMRNAVAIGFPLTERISASVGYLNQYRFRPGRDLMEHALTTGLSFDF